MKYLLDQEEYDALLRKAELKGLALKKTIQDLCIKVAVHMPIIRDWDKDRNPPEPSGCVIENPKQIYCDDCPVSNVCPREHKEWSK